MNATLTDLKPTLDNFKVMSDSLKRLELNQTLQQMQLTLKTLTESMSKFSEHDNTMGRLMTEDSLYVNLNNLILRIDSLAVHFNENPKHFMAPLGKSSKKIAKDKRKEEEKAKKETNSN
jgi:phospholipid/cholesterol/gamma-HCH transport system substrate-binding protein